MNQFEANGKNLIALREKRGYRFEDEFIKFPLQNTYQYRPCLWLQFFRDKRI